MKSSEIMLLGLGLLVLERLEEMEKKLTDAITDLNTEVEDESSKLASIQTYVTGVPGIVAAAVAEALANVGVEEAAAADQIEAARQQAADSVSATLAAVEANTPASDTGASAGVDTGGAGTTGSETGGAGGDTSGASGADAGAGAGVDTGTGTGADAGTGTSGDGTAGGDGTGGAPTGDAPIE